MFQQLVTGKGETGCIKRGWEKASDSLESVYGMGVRGLATLILKGTQGKKLMVRCISWGREEVSLEGPGVKEVSRARAAGCKESRPGLHAKESVGQTHNGAMAKGPRRR